MQPPHPRLPDRAIPPVPAALAIILYDQMNNPAPTPTPPTPGGVTSQDYEPQLDSYDSFAADDFVIPAGQIWNITEVDVIGESSEPPAPPDSFHVFFYTDSGNAARDVGCKPARQPIQRILYFFNHVDQSGDAR